VSRQDRPPTSKTDERPPEAPVEDDVRLQIDLRLPLDEVAAAEEKEVRRSAGRRPTKRELMRLALRLYDARRQRWKVFGSRLFGEPAWDMLLALYCLPTRGWPLSVTSLCHAADVPEATGYRWQAKLIEDGLIERGPHWKDRRSSLVRLTNQGRRLMEKYLVRLYQCETNHAAAVEEADD
jgi:DNA-binding MarR family transcriptional regulator